MREITLDTVQGKDLLKPCVLGGLIQLPCRRVTARIPLQSETALWAISDSFPPGEAILRPCGALGDRRSPQYSSAKQQFTLQAIVDDLGCQGRNLISGSFFGAMLRLLGVHSALQPTADPHHIAGFAG